MPNSDSQSQSPPPHEPQSEPRPEPAPEPGPAAKFPALRPVPELIREEFEILTAGAVDVLPRDEFIDRLVESRKTGRPLRVKLGCDPSSPDLHIGHTIVINKLRQFQEFGHQVVFIVGDFTARIGDPTGKSETRKALTPEQTAANAKTYLEQIFKILDPEKTEVVGNASWFDKMSMNDAISLASRYTVARMLERDDFSRRHAEGRPIHIHEFLYPLVQGHDSVEVRSDIELGGTDQKFNLLVGRDLMEQAGMRGQMIMTMPLLVGLDGVNKMSKSLGNAIGITDDPADIYGKAMSVPDSMMRDYLLLALSKPRAEVERILGELASGGLHPRDAKAGIARELTARYHGEEAAARAEEGFIRLFREREIPEEIEEAELAFEGPTIRLAAVLARTGLAETGAQAKRLIQQGGVSVNGEKVGSEGLELAPGEVLIKVGKRRFKRIKLTSTGPA